LPSAGVPATWASSIPERRPRIESGVTWSRIVERRTALMKSAAPAAASISSASGSTVAKPNAAIATPHPAAAMQTPSPWRRTRVIQPETSEAISAPADGAA
jgi:hypothetical protein